MAWRCKEPRLQQTRSWDSFHKKARFHQQNFNWDWIDQINTHTHRCIIFLNIHTHTCTRTIFLSYRLPFRTWCGLTHGYSSQYQTTRIPRRSYDEWSPTSGGSERQGPLPRCRIPIRWVFPRWRTRMSEEPRSLLPRYYILHVVDGSGQYGFHQHIFGERWMPTYRNWLLFWIRAIGLLCNN